MCLNNTISNDELPSIMCRGIHLMYVCMSDSMLIYVLSQCYLLISIYTVIEYVISILY